MRKYIGSSWNPDRVAGSVLNKQKKERAAKPKSKVTVYKTKDLYTKEYGKMAYEAWLDRETEINACMKDRKRFDVAQIVHLRETSFRMMKAGADQHDLNLDISGNIVLRTRKLRHPNTELRLAA